MQQLRVLKHRNDQKNSSYSGNNVADEVLEVLKMLNENDFVQKVEHTKGQNDGDDDNESVNVSCFM
jgi:hypothetical protein